MTLSRRTFLSSCFAASALAACSRTDPRISQGFADDRGVYGHQFGTVDNIKKLDQHQYDCIIVGSGISGLACARQLKKMGISNYLILESGETIGGNSSALLAGRFQAPWGAHYLPLPDETDQELLEFLLEAGIATSLKPLTFNESFICALPRERSFYKGSWHEGLFPQQGTSRTSREEYSKFLQWCHELKMTRGIDGKFFFSIPLANCSADSTYRKLDSLPFALFLRQQGYSSDEFFWYIDYCCRDDFGIGAEYISTYAGLHYFCARRSGASNAQEGEVLTWPEGNNFLVQKLAANQPIKTFFPVSALEEKPDRVLIHSLFADRILQAKFVVCATPRYVVQELLGQPIRGLASDFHPWLVANIVLQAPPDSASPSLSWDNIIFKGKGLGYIEAKHQQRAIASGETLLTVYHPLSDNPDAAVARRKLRELTFAEARTLIFEDLLLAHPEIDSLVTHCWIWRWAHGMIAPKPNFLETAQKLERRRGRLFFAHSEQSGMSLFEEAFYQGNKTAELLLPELRGQKP